MLKCGFKGALSALSILGVVSMAPAVASTRAYKGLIADSVLKDVDGLKAKLVSGEIVVPNYFDLKPGQKEMGKPPMATPPSVANPKWRSKLEAAAVSAAASFSR